MPENEGLCSRSGMNQTDKVMPQALRTHRGADGCFPLYTLIAGHDRTRTHLLLPALEKRSQLTGIVASLGVRAVEGDSGAKAGKRLGVLVRLIERDTQVIEGRRR